MKRNGYIDFIKGIAILLVLVGHTIQYCYGAEYFLRGTYFSNPVFKFIYTFHMPLFMAVSGYLLQQALSHRSEREMALRRLRQLGVPILSFGVLAFAIKWAVHPIFNIIDCAEELLHTCLGNLWFLWALLYGQLLLLLIRRMGDKVWVYVLAGVLIYFIPGSRYMPAHYTFLYPFLVLGYMTGKYSLNRIYTGKWCLEISASMLMLYVGALYATRTLLADVWDWGVLGSVLHTVMRQLIAFFALGWILPLLYGVHKVYSAKCIVRFIMDAGQNSLGIYYFQTLIFIFISRTCHLLPSLGVWGAFIGGVVVTAECLLLTRWSKRYGITRLLVLGGNYR